VCESARQKLVKKQTNYTIKGVFLGDCPIKLKLFRLFVDYYNSVNYLL
jgi:hypothetical protein